MAVSAVSVSADDLYRFAHAGRILKVERDNPRQHKARKKEYADTMAEYRAWWMAIASTQRKAIVAELQRQHQRGENPDFDTAMIKDTIALLTSVNPED